MKLEKLNEKNVQIEKSEMSALKGGTDSGSSTTLMIVVGYAENEYYDANGNGKFDEGDIPIGTKDIPLPSPTPGKN